MLCVTIIIIIITIITDNHLNVKRTMHSGNIYSLIYFHYVINNFMSKVSWICLVFNKYHVAKNDYSRGPRYFKKSGFGISFVL